MKLIAISCFLVSSALPIKSDAFPIHHDVHDITRPHSHLVVNPTSSSVLLGRRKNAKTPMFALPPSPLSSSSQPLFDGNFSSISDGDNMRELMAVRGGDTTSSTSSLVDKTKAFVSKNFFLLGMVVAVSLAKLFPELGKNGSLLRPELFIGKYGVTVIFLLSGLSLKLAELKSAAKNMKLNAMIQAATFGAWPFLVGLPLTKGLETFLPNLLPKPLLEGILILMCLPTTINMCILLTSASGGNVATALCNTVISNLAGIFITPALLLRFFGKSIELPFFGLVSKLCNKVLLPVALGQALRATPMKDLYSKHTAFFKRLQEMVLLGIVWNAFCNAFTRGLGLEFHHGIALLIMLPILHLGSLLTLFTLFRSKFVGATPGEAVAATFCGAHKTLAFGLPLINTIFEGNPNLAAYCAPIMLMHPLQLVVGSLIVPYFAKITEEKTE
eukprot:CAMPEP_0201916580 /NCGR_PEP_ID=MMETSP0903-20130614/6183_1 /ASSEMBLY_ACC=CAM_ASM_000552 /TAXON_ID=420261 /ORGANISM="Thalassiosira antarctica, Strain CCMP982" /LENGTH=442 /DNA_ID=CAMNT_0048452435 /DNA_START=13 /DNA_END=1344 /DNA_ORIENTATION=+